MAVDEGFQYAIPVPHPSSSIALTPPRKSDGPEVLATLNDQRVYMNLIGPPYPYTQKDWEEWYSFISYAALECSRELQAIQHLRQTSGAGDSEIDSQRTRWVSQPMWPSTIRELPEPNSSSDTGRFIGAITVERGQFLYVLDDRERQRWKRENDSLAAGDPKIIWEVGCRSTTLLLSS